MKINENYESNMKDIEDDMALGDFNDGNNIYLSDDFPELKKEYEKYYRTDNPLEDIRFERYVSLIEDTDPIKFTGRVKNVTGLVIEGNGPEASIGELCTIQLRNKKEMLAEVVGFEDDSIKLMGIGSMDGISSGALITATGHPLKIPVGDQLLGRILNGIGKPIDGGIDVHAGEYRSVISKAPEPLKRKRIKKTLSVGVRAIDGILTIGRGQRVGIFSGSGVGKSILLSMMARNTEADINVIALVGERGKEVRDFIEKDLTEEGLARSVIVVATAEQEPLVRIRAAYVATAIAEYFRDQGKDVLFLMDSLTRFAQAQRQIGLSIGEPPTTKGFTPSVFSALPKLIERTGTSDKGTITAFYTVLVEGDDDINDPIADAARGHLDGHIVLSRDLAMHNHYPAIDILASISRAMVDLVDDSYLKTAGKVREIIKVYKDAEDIINIGAYAHGSNPKIDKAITMIERINEYLKQGIYESSDLDEAMEGLKAFFVETKKYGHRTRTGRGVRA